MYMLIINWIHQKPADHDLHHFQKRVIICKIAIYSSKITRQKIRYSNKAHNAKCKVRSFDKSDNNA